MSLSNKSESKNSFNVIFRVLQNIINVSNVTALTFPFIVLLIVILEILLFAKNAVALNFPFLIIPLNVNQ